MSVSKYLIRDPIETSNPNPWIIEINRYKLYNQRGEKTGTDAGKG